MKSHVNSPLPPDIMVEILLLLPLESILTCKAVSKEWKNLIEDSTFIKLYDAESTTLFLSGNRLNCLFRRDDNNSYKIRRTPIKLNDKFHQHELLVESSNKIACVKSYDGRFHLHNLITGDSRVVADAPLGHGSFRVWLCYGFAYDSYEDDYKIVVVYESTMRSALLIHEWRRFDNLKTISEGDTKSGLIFVYSYRDRGWKLSNGFPRSRGAHYWPSARGFSFNGHLHWVVEKRVALDSWDREAVDALDVHSYGLTEFALPPPFYTGKFTPNANLSELDGRLCCSLDGDTFDVWAMKEYGVPESWTKLFGIRHSRISRGPLYEIKHTALRRCRDGGRRVVVFLRHVHKFELFRYEIDEDEIQIFSKLTPRRKLLLGLKTRLKRLRMLFA